MNVSVFREQPGRYVVRCPAEMEWVARVDLVARLRAVAGDNRIEAIIVDLDNVTYINSAGIGALFGLRRFAQEADARMVVAAARPTIARLLRTANLPALVRMTATLGEAHAALQGATR